MERHAPEFFESWIGRHVGLPKGFDAHYRDDVIPDMRIIRDNPMARDGARQELRDLLADQSRVKNLYREGGETYSEILDKWANRVEDGHFSRVDSPITDLKGEETGMFRRAPRAGRNRRSNGQGGRRQ